MKMTLIFVLVFHLFCMRGFSQNQLELKDSFDCDKVLITTKIDHKLDNKTFNHLLSLVNRDNFEEFQRAYKAGGGVNIFEELNLTVNAEFPEFAKKRSQYNAQYGHTTNIDLARRTIASYLPRYISSDWLECQKLKVRTMKHLTGSQREKMQAEIRILRAELEFKRLQNPGIKISIKKKTLRNVIIKIQWRPPAYFTSSAKILSQYLKGGSVKNVPEGKLMNENPTFRNHLWERDIIIERDPKKEIGFGFTVGVDEISFSDSDVILPDNLEAMLFSALETNNISLVRSAIEMGADINATNKSQTPLMIASKNGYDQIVDLLLKQKSINVDAQDSIGQTALYQALDKPSLVTIKKLLEKGARPNIAINNIGYEKGVYYGWTPLNFASYSYYSYDKGSKWTDPSAPDKKHLYLRAIKILRDGGGKIYFEKQTRRWFFYITSNGQTDELKYMINSGKDANLHIDNQKNTCINLAAERCHIDIVKYLLGIPNIRLNLRNIYNDTPLIIAEATTCDKKTEISNLIRNAGGRK